LTITNNDKSGYKSLSTINNVFLPSLSYYLISTLTDIDHYERYLVTERHNSAYLML